MMLVAGLPAPPAVLCGVLPAAPARALLPLREDGPQPLPGTGVACRNTLFSRITEPSIILVCVMETCSIFPVIERINVKKPVLFKMILSNSRHQPGILELKKFTD
jgi:hypothetical protein